MKKIKEIMNQETWSLEDAIHILRCETIEDLEDAGMGYEDLEQLADDVAAEAIGEWDDGDESFPNNPVKYGLIFEVNGEKVYVSTGYSGVAGNYWQDGPDGTFWE